MNTVFRILVILVVASLVGGVLYVGVNVAAGPVTVSDEGESRPKPPEGAEFRPELEEHDEDRGLSFPRGMIKALVLITFAGVGYSALVWTGKKARQVVAG